MKRWSLLLGTSVTLAACGSISQNPNQMAATPGPNAYERVALNQALLELPKESNVVWSSASVEGMFAILGGAYTGQAAADLEMFLGAKPEETAKVVRSLNISGHETLPTVLSANQVWVQDAFEVKQSYLDYLNLNFDGMRPLVMDVSQPDAVVEEVNAWAADATNDMIKEVITTDNVDGNLISLMANALYFKGSWKQEFDKKMTAKGAFTSIDAQGLESQAQVNMMNLEVDHFQVVKSSAKGYTLRLPYEGDQHAMYISFAPRVMFPSQRTGVIKANVDAEVDVVEIYNESITQGKAFAAFKASSSAHQPFMGLAGSLSMPKFEIETSLDAIHEVMAAHGLQSLFGAGALGNFSDDAMLALDFVLQKAKIIVDEEGSEAAAVTIGGSVRTSAPMLTVSLSIDGPFAFAIRDDVNGVTLFEGVVRSLK